MKGSLSLDEKGLGSQTQAGPHRAKFGPASVSSPSPQGLLVQLGVSQLACSCPQSTPRPRWVGLFVVLTVDFELCEAPSFHKP